MEHLDGGALLLIGLMLLAGYLAHLTGKRIHVPRVTLLLALGVLCGPAVLDLVPADTREWFPFVTRIALAMVGFLLGESFVGRDLREHGRSVLAISIGETVGAALMVFLAVLLVTGDLVLALLLAGIAPASAPAAIYDTVEEARARGPLTATLLGVVAIDDAWGVMMFSILLVAAGAVTGQGPHLGELAGGFVEVTGALVLGAAVGFVMAWVTRRVREGGTTLVEAAGFVLTCAGLAALLELSYLLATMTVGAVLANRRGKDDPAFHDIHDVSQPFLAIFFVLAGLELDPASLAHIGWIGAAYAGARVLGLALGGSGIAVAIGAPREVSRRIGWCLMPQAGVALGLALLARERLPGAGTTVLQIVIGTTVLFELIGPLVARWQLRAAGEM